MKLRNTNICLTSRKTIMVLIVIFFSTLVLASVWPKEVEEIIIEEGSEGEQVEIWIPTE